MIDINEIRQGNYIKYSAHDYWAKFIQGCPVQVDLDIYLDIDKHPDCFDPIELNPEWLQKCGFIDPAKNGLAYRMDINLADELCWYVQDGYLRYQTSLNGFTRPREHIKHVHQLQNFFYWHTGKELTIKSFNQSN